MPRVLPTVSGRYGMTGDSAASPLSVQINCNAGDQIVAIALTSDSLRVINGVPTGLPGATFAGPHAAVNVVDYANAYTWWATAAQSGSPTISISPSAGNAGAQYVVFRIFVFSGSEGFGNASLGRANGGAPQISWNQARDASMFPFGVVDWNAAGGAAGLYANYTLDSQFNGGAATYVHAWCNNAGAAGTKNVGLSGPTNWKWSMSGIEVYGRYVDDIPPAGPASVTAVANSPTQVTVSWTASTDNIAVRDYTIKRNGVIIKTGHTTTSYVDTAVTAGGTYTYTVQAFDTTGNASTETTSNTVGTGVRKIMLGGTTVQGIKLGAADSKVYLGSTLVFAGTAKTDAMTLAKGPWYADTSGTYTDPGGTGPSGKSIARGTSSSTDHGWGLYMAANNPTMIPAGTKVDVSFYARAGAAATHWFMVTNDQANDTPGANQSANIDTTWQSYTLSFTLTANWVPGTHRFRTALMTPVGSWFEWSDARVIY